MFIKRPGLINTIKNRFESSPVVALLGPRQCGKTTLAIEFQKLFKKVHHFDLEDHTDLERLDNPKLALDNLDGLIVIDEIQRRPELFPYIRVLVDKKPNTKLLILGSASRDLLQQSSETLAGRISYIECSPFRMHEIHSSQQLIERGGFPRSFLSNSDESSYQWRQDYITTFLERDIPNLGFRIPPKTMRRFWMMLTHYHGQIFNSSELGKSLGIAHTTVRHYLDILVGTFMVRELSPWIANIGKRQIKSPKIYFRDSGIYLTLLGVNSANKLNTHPKIGAVWEGFAMEQLITFHNVSQENCFYWGVHQQSELDLLLHIGSKKVGFEFKYQDAPKLTKSMKSSMEILELNELYTIYPGTKSYHLAEDITVYPLQEYIQNHLSSKGAN